MESPWKILRKFFCPKKNQYKKNNCPFLSLDEHLWGARWPWKMLLPSCHHWWEEKGGVEVPESWRELIYWRAALFWNHLPLEFFVMWNNKPLYCLMYHWWSLLQLAAEKPHYINMKPMKYYQRKHKVTYSETLSKTNIYYGFGMSWMPHQKSFNC